MEKISGLKNASDRETERERERKRDERDLLEVTSLSPKIGKHSLS